MRFIITVTLIFLLLSCSKAPITMHQDLRTTVLTQLHRLGSDTSKPHEFEFYLYLPTEGIARQAGQRLTNSDFQIEIKPPVEGTNWLCLAKTKITPDTAPLSQMGNMFTHLAEELHGDFDGWESEVVKPQGGSGKQVTLTNE